ncbi:hypothetical protein AAVH_06542 [Aphelenchoides avenae]|nr:hypothetical protein AAVH_06542 [Aphelenchus avenae]
MGVEAYWRHNGWAACRYYVDENLCYSGPGPKCTRTLFTLPEVIIDALSFLTRCFVEDCQLVSRRYRDLIMSNATKLPRHVLTRVVFEPFVDNTYLAWFSHSESGRFQEDVQLQSLSDVAQIMPFVRNSVITDLKLGDEFAEYARHNVLRLFTIQENVVVIQLKLKQEEATPLTATTDSISALLEHVQTRWSRLPALSFTGKELPEVVLSNTLTGGFRYINTAGRIFTP